MTNEEKAASFSMWPKTDQFMLCAPKDEYLAIITAYLPATNQWSSDYKVRR